MSDIKFEVIFLYRYRYLGDGDTDLREILHDGTYRHRNFLGNRPGDSVTSNVLNFSACMATKAHARSVTNFCTGVGVHDVITSAKFYDCRTGGFGVVGVTF